MAKIIKLISIGLCIPFIFFSCGEKLPEGLIPSDKMPYILADAHLAEASILNFVLEERDSLGSLYYQQIFRIHQTDEETFYRSVEYYSRQPKVWESIYLEIEKINQTRIDQTKAKIKKPAVD